MKIVQKEDVDLERIDAYMCSLSQLCFSEKLWPSKDVRGRVEFDTFVKRKDGSAARCVSETRQVCACCTGSIDVDQHLAPVGEHVRLAMR